MDIISRTAANLPPPPAAIGTRSLSSWAGITVHHTGGPFSSWRAIYDWQVILRPAGQRLAYIGYSFGIANGRITELSGWDRHPAHDHENSRLGVVFGGNYQSSLPPAADLDALVWLIGEARRRTGRPALPVITHREVWPAGDWRATSCPGDRLYRWCKDTLPGRLAVPAPRKGADMTPDELMRHRIPRVADGETMTVATALSYAHHHAHALRSETARLASGQAAIIAAVSGAGQSEILARIDAHHAAQMQAIARAEAALTEAARERAALAELVQRGQSGELDAAEVVRLIGERLVAAGDGEPLVAAGDADPVS